MATWPASLPAPTIGSYTVKDTPKLLRTALASGPDRLTRFTAHYMTRGTATIVVDESGADAFRSMMANSADGANWVDDVPLDTGQGKTPTRARLAAPSWRVDGFKPGQYWKITFQFETDQRMSP